MIIEINHQPQFKLNKNNFIIISLILTTSILSSCVKPYGRHSSTSNPISINIAGGASLILDANTLTGTTSPGGSCSVSRWNDSSGAGNTGTINCATGGGFAGSGIPSDPFRIVFNGLSTSVTTFLNAQPNTMASSTWVAWIKPASTTFQEILSIDGHTGAFNRTVMIDNATQDFGVFNPFNSIFTTKPVDLGAWQFIAVTFAPSDIVFTKNGTFVNLGVPPNYTSTLQLFTIGRSAGGFIDFYNGAIAWLAVYPRALTTSEIDNTCRALLFRFNGATCN